MIRSNPSSSPSGTTPPVGPETRWLVSPDDLADALSKSSPYQALVRRLDELLALVRGKAKSHYTVDEVAAMTGRAPYTVRRWIQEGRLTATRVGGTGPRGRLLVACEGVQRLIDAGLGDKVLPLECAE